MKKLGIILCTLSIILNILLFFSLQAKETEYRNQLENVKKVKAETKKAEDYQKENIVFLGDSITDWCPFDGLYEDYIPIVNSGKAGYRTFELLPELKELVYKYNPTKVFILIGTNDLNTHTGKKDLVENIEKMIKRIKKNRPKCKIYVQSIYPVNRTEDDKIDLEKVSKRENKEIKEVNNKIKKLCDKHNVTYINVFNHLIDEDGNLALKYTKDGLHLNNLGYLKVTKILTPYVEE